MSIRVAVEKFLVASGYDVVRDERYHEAMRRLAIFADDAVVRPGRLDGRVLSYGSTITVDLAEGTYAVARAREVLRADPVILGRIAVRVGAVLVVRVVGFFALRWLLYRHERRVRSGEIPAGVS
ncbi:MAG: hypothetical protein AAFZ67_13890 [Planctomycetota bacterium]